MTAVQEVQILFLSGYYEVKSSSESLDPELDHRNLPRSWSSPAFTSHLAQVTQGQITRIYFQGLYILKNLWIIYRKNILTALVMDFSSLYTYVQVYNLQNMSQLTEVTVALSLTAHRLRLISPFLYFWGSNGFQEQISFRMFCFLEHLSTWLTLKNK